MTVPQLLSPVLKHGDSLSLLRELPDESVDAVITDPPYSSGGAKAGDRTKSTGSKYVQSGQKLARPDFAGDNRDQRSWLYWCALWSSECLRVVKPGGYFLMFTDWRQLPQASDALQCGGFIWRGLLAWDKTEASRSPHTGYFRHQCEYVVWGSKGHLGHADGRGPWPGCYRFGVKQRDKHHQTGKPTELMERLIECVQPGGVVLDPFMGSGTTGVACANTGRRFIGFEATEDYFAIAQRRVMEATARRCA